MFEPFNLATLFSNIFGSFPFIWVVFLAVLAVYLMYSLVLGYHWFRYGLNPLTVFVMMGIYAGVSLLLLGVTYEAASAISTPPSEISNYVSYK